MKTARNFFVFATILMVVIFQPNLFGQKKLSKPTVLSDKAFAKYPALQENIFDVQFFLSSEVELKKPLGREDQVVDGRLVIKNTSLEAPRLTKARVFYISTDKDNVLISIDSTNQDETALALTRNRKGVYKLSGVGPKNTHEIISKKRKVKILFDPNQSKENIKKLPGDEVGGK